MSESFLNVTELAGDEISGEQIERMHHRYTWAAGYCEGRAVVEMACGTGPGLGLLAAVAESVEAGDFDEAILAIARDHYAERVALERVDAMAMPYADHSKDVVILFEAIYYLPDAGRFVAECARVLRPGGRVLIATANRDLSDFNPSPYSHRYYGAADLRQLFEAHGFSCELFGYMPVDEISWKQRILRPVKRAVVSLGLMPKTMAGKKLLKRLVFGGLVAMPAELSGDEAAYQPPAPLPGEAADRRHKVIYCAATLPADTPESE